MKPIRRKCKHCGEWYKPVNSTTEPCPKYECRVLEFEKKKPKIIRTIQKQRKSDLLKEKEKHKKLSEYEADAKKSFQHFIRLRDKDLNCISCGVATCDQWAGGHFYPAGNYSGMIFNEMNCHKQCNQYCNKFLGGNTQEYRKGLIKRYGQEYVDKLDSEAVFNRKKKFDKFELIEIKSVYDKKIKELLNNK